MARDKGVPLVIGAKGGKGGGSGAIEDSDTLASRAYAQVLDLICEGEVEGLVGGMQGVYLDGTPLQNPDGSFNFSGVSFAFQPGSQGQNYIAGFSEIDTEYSVGLVVHQSSPIVRTITNTDVDAVRVVIGVPQLTSQDVKTGDIHGTSFDVAIDVQTAGGGYVQRLYDTVSGKTSNYQRAYRIELYGAGPWDIRVRRITADSVVSALTNAFNWATYTEIIDAKLTYPNSAIVALRMDSAQFQSIPQRAYRMRLLRVQVPSNYDPVTRAYSGAWDGTFKIAWTNNPAWCFYDLLTNERYGLGEFVSAGQVDKWALYQIGQYCDVMVPNGFGTQEPRFALNCYIQNYADAFKVVQDLASCFRGMPFWTTGTVTAVQDAPSSPVALFTQANVLNGAFSYSGSSLKARHTVALVTWFNMDDMARPYVEYVEDTEGIARYGVIQTQVTAFGCTSRGQAHRVGKWLLYSERSEAETVTFRTGLEGVPVRPGDVIKVSDAMRAGQSLGGRISASDGLNTVTIDRDLVDVNKAAVNPIGASINIVSIDGAVRTGSITGVNGRKLTVASNQGLANMLSGVQAQALWVIETSGIAAQLFRVIQVTEADRGQYDITAVAHNPSKYDAIEYGLALEVRDISDLSTRPSAPTSVQVSENLYLYQSNVFSLMTISWPSVIGATAYKVGYSKDGANWVFENTPANELEIRMAAPGSYDVRVWTIGASQLTSSAYAETVQSILGKFAPPADVQGLTFGIDQNAGAKLAWAPNTDVDLYAYEVRKATSGTDWASATSLGQIKATAFTIGVQGCVGTYLVKAIDTSGNYSVNAATVAVTMPVAPAPVVAGVFSGPNYNLTWNQVLGNLATDHYEIRTDLNFGQTAGLITTQKGTSYSAKVNWSGTVVFYVAAVDIGGNYGGAGQATLVVNAPILPVITQQVIDNNVLLRWTAANATLPLDHYIVARGTTFAGATVLGTISGTFDVIFETTPGSFTYWIAGVDSAGNQGPAASVTAFVNQPPDYVLRYNYDAFFDGLIDDFRAGAINADFTVSGATMAAGAGMTLTSTGTNPQLIRTWQLIENHPNGCEYPIVRVKLTRVAGSGWTGKAYWSTAGHGFTTGYYQTNATNPAIGAQVTIDWDMRAPTAGGTDYMMNALSGIRLDLGATAADVFRIDYIELVPFLSTNVVEDVDRSLVMPVNTTETFQQHFDSHTWAAPSNQVAAGYPIFIEPGLTTSTYVEYIDYGTVLPATRVSVTPTYVVIDGAPSLSVTIEVSTDGVTWTTYANTTAVYVTNFRYARYTVTVTGAGHDLLRLQGINYRYDVKLKNDAGTVQALSTDTNGTPVTFAVGFIAVTSITVTANTTSPVFAVYNFDGSKPNPTGFTVMIFDKNGNRVAGQVSWSAKGV
jgi:predicted phage tail protein